MRKSFSHAIATIACVSFFAIACQKDYSPQPDQSETLTEEGRKKDKDHGQLQHARNYSADLVKRWLGVQTSMLYRPSGNPYGFNANRYIAYCGVALYESIVPGMPGYRTLYGQLNAMPELPRVRHGYSYHWPSAANAALASMTRKFFSLVPAIYNEQAITDLENELNNQYKSQVGQAVFLRSSDFGKQIAEKIFSWAQTDNAAWPTTPYSLPAFYPGMWQPESGAPVNPYWGYNRLIVRGSLNNVASPPLTYSTNPNSKYYREMNEVYKVSKQLTHEQKLIAKYYNDVNPGYPAGAHYISTLKQVIEQLRPALDKAALTYAKTGITLLDASTSSFKVKYQHLAERPFQFIRNVIEPGVSPVWQPFLPTPGFPDFPSNHAVFSSSVAYALTSIYGHRVAFTDASYEGVMADLGNGLENLGSRHFRSFKEMADEISISRLYGGIHYRYSCEEGMKQGRKVAENIDRKVKFRRDD